MCALFHSTKEKIPQKCIRKTHTANPSMKKYTKRKPITIIYMNHMPLRMAIKIKQKAKNT
jgi:hypothetical protein